MARKTTIHDIALRLNVTASTVSRALNDHPKISDATKKAVIKVAKELHYQPNNIAAALRRGKSHLIGVIVPTVDRAFFSSVIRGIEEIASDYFYKVIISQSYDDFNEEVETLNALANARVDGILASISKKTIDVDHFQKVIDKGIPLMLFDRTSDQLDVNQVMIDDYQGAYDVVTHLIDEGCKRIAHFTSPVKISIYKERLRGYKDALRENNIEFDSSLVIESDLQLEDGRKSMFRLIKENNMPDAVFSASDYAAVGAMQVLKENNISIPQQVALAGFANEPFTSFTDPPLTTVDQLSLDMGHITAELFFDLLENNKKNKKHVQRTVLKPRLIKRQSSMKKQIRMIDDISYGKAQ